VTDDAFRIPLLLENFADEYSATLQQPDSLPRELLLSAYAAFCASIGDVPHGRVRMVATADMVGSVRSREDDRGDLDPYTNERGAGMVAAKNMPGPDGGVDVLFQGIAFFPQNAGDIANLEWLRKTNRHTAAHEAFHARQTITNPDLYKTSERKNITGYASVTYVTFASRLISEYAAETFSNQQASANEIDADSFAGTFGAWKTTLEERLPSIPEDENYFHKGMEVSLVAVNNVWISLAYLAAALATDGGFDPVPASISSLKGWDEFALQRWGRLTEILGCFPIGSDPDVDLLDQATLDLADLLKAWFLELGFDFHDSAEGGFFRITLWD